jgi:vitamin B12 transporter
VHGLAVNRSSGVGQLRQLCIRGAEGNHTLVLIDGIEMNDPAAGSEFDFARLLATDIERIEILHGPQSVLYSSDAIGGVVNIITKRGYGRPTFTGSLEGGSFGTGQVNASVSGGGEQYHFLLSGVGLHTDSISATSERRGNHEADREENVTVYGKLGWSPLDVLALDFIGHYTDFRTAGDDFVGGLGAVDADNETKGEQLFARAQAKLQLFAGRWEHILFLEDRANVNLGGIYNGRQSDFAFDTFFNRSIVQLASYTLVNLSASYQLTNHVQLFARIEHLFDDHYEEVFTFGTPGRAAYGGVRVRF